MELFLCFVDCEISHIVNNNKEGWGTLLYDQFIFYLVDLVHRMLLENDS